MHKINYIDKYGNCYYGEYIDIYDKEKEFYINPFDNKKSNKNHDVSLDCLEYVISNPSEFIDSSNVLDLYLYIMRLKKNRVLDNTPYEISIKYDLLEKITKYNIVHISPISSFGITSKYGTYKSYYVEYTDNKGYVYKGCWQDFYCNPDFTDDSNYRIKKKQYR